MDRRGEFALFSADLGLGRDRSGSSFAPRSPSLCIFLAFPTPVPSSPAFLQSSVKLVDLHVYALNPCLEFWEDVEGANTIGRDRFVRRGHKVGEALERVEDPFSLDASGENAALRQWGKPGREYIRLLNELTDCDFDSHFKHPPPGTMLARLQESILCREPEASSASPPGSLPNDESIRFLACPGIRREVEIVADSIWSLIRDDEKRGGSDPLRFHQIGVLIPDAELDSYLPHVETVFTQRHQIPLDLVDRPFSWRGPGGGGRRVAAGASDGTFRARRSTPPGDASGANRRAPRLTPKAGSIGANPSGSFSEPTNANWPIPTSRPIITIGTRGCGGLRWECSWRLMAAARCRPC